MHNTKKIRNSLTIKYAIVQGLYWMIYCSMYGFASSFLLDNNFQNKSVGVITAVANIFAVFLQPYLGSLVDRVYKITVKKLLTLLALITLCLNVLIIFTAHLNPILLAILFTTSNILMLTLQPLINSLIYEYINQGIDVNYGATRGIGSLTYALISYILGGLLSHHSALLLTFVASALLVLFIVMIQLFPKISDNKQQQFVKEAQKENYWQFLNKYKALIPFLLAVVFVYVTHTYLNTFMLQILESLGGSNSELGRATLTSALSELPMMFAFAYVVKYIKGSTLLKWSAFFYVLRCALIISAHNVEMVYLSQLFQSLSFAIFTPASVYYINKLVNDEDKVKGQTVMLGASTLGGVIGNFTGGYVLDISSVQVMLIIGLITSAVAIVFYFIASQRESID